MKLAIIMGLCAAIGGVVGGSGVLCDDGSCAITGTWMGGGFMGGVLGFALGSALMTQSATASAEAPNEPAESQDA